MLPKNQVDCDVETAKANIALIEWLEDLKMSMPLYHNMNLPDELLSRLSGLLATSERRRVTLSTLCHLFSVS